MASFGISWNIAIGGIEMKLTIDKNWFDKNKAEFLAAGKKQAEEWGDNSIDAFYEIDLEGLKFEDIKIKDEGNILEIMGTLPPAEEEDIWLGLEIPLDTNLQLELVQAVLKKMNKMKAVLEGLK